MRSAHESQVAYYSGRWPCVFDRAAGAEMFDVSGRRFLDFFCGAGSLNYGHNDPDMTAAMVAYLAGGRVLTTLDMQTAARAEFIDTFNDVVLSTRRLKYRMQFTSPSGSDCVEAALRLARRVTGRDRVACLSGAFHGETRGAAAVSQRWAGVEDPTVVRIRHESDSSLSESSLGLEDLFDANIAALIVETVQGEGGCRPLSSSFIDRARAACDSSGALLIIDDVQAGCGRTGPFLSIEDFTSTADVICLSKSLSGSGLPLSMMLLRPEFDVWDPGEFSGTFRGQNLAFITGTVALRKWWSNRSLEGEVRRKSELLRSVLAELAEESLIPTVGRGLMLGLVEPSAEAADGIAASCFRGGLVVETCGVSKNILKLMPPLTVTDAEIDEAVAILRSAHVHGDRDARELRGAR